MCVSFFLIFSIELTVEHDEKRRVQPKDSEEMDVFHINTHKQVHQTILIATESLEFWNNRRKTFRVFLLVRSFVCFVSFRFSVIIRIFFLMWFVTLNLGFIYIRFYSHFVMFHSGVMYFISSLKNHNNSCKAKSKATSSFMIVTFMKNWVMI